MMEGGSVVGIVGTSQNKHITKDYVLGPINLLTASNRLACCSWPVH